MKLLSTISATMVVATLSLSSQAQKIKLVSGDLSALKGQSTVNIEFTYDNMSVGKYNEAEYIATKKAEYNKKEPGKGDNWEKSWVNDREAQFEPKFIVLFEKYSDFKVKKDSKYTLIFHTKATEPGYNIGISSKPSDIDGEFLLVETADKSKVLATITIDNSKGRSFGGYDFDTGLRISEAYELAGKTLAKFIMDKI